MIHSILTFIGNSAAILFPTVAILYVIWKSFANAASDQYITLERRWFGKKMTDGRTVALSGEIGLQAKVLGPGLHWFWPFITKAMKHN